MFLLVLPVIYRLENRPDAGASAPAPAFLHLGKDKCNGSGKSKFVAEENIRYLFSLQARITSAFSSRLFLMVCRLRNSKRNGTVFNWSAPQNLSEWDVDAERQPRSGCWHCHAVVDMRRDIKTGFPFEEVARKDYRNVDRELRALWRLVRMKAKAYGFGWNTLEPIKTNGKVAAKYLAKYLSKAQSSDFRVGEERARLFGVWGRKALRVSSFLLGEWPNFSSAVILVCQGIRSGRCYRYAKALRRKLVASDRTAIAPRSAARGVLSSLGLEHEEIFGGRSRAPCPVWRSETAIGI